MNRSSTGFAFLAAMTLVLGTSATRAASQHPPGGAGGDAQQKVKELTERIAKQMRKIDELLNRAARSQPTGGGSGDAAEAAKTEHSKVVDETLERSDDVVKAIDELLRVSEQERSRNNQSRDQQRDQERDRQNEQRRQPEDRGQNMPDYQRQQDDRHRNADPQNPRGDDKPGEQRKGGTPPENPTGKSTRVNTAGRWGFLPTYLEWLFRKGGGPEVPAKYRRFAEEFHKKADTGKSARRR